MIARRKTARSGNRSAHRKGRPLVANGRRVVQPPMDVPAGKARCDACRNVASLTPTGRLRRHHDLFGLDCWNTTAPAPEGTRA